MTAEATFAGTLPAIQRTQDHRYLYTDPITGTPYELAGVTGLLKLLHKGDNLDRWRDKTLAETALKLAQEYPGGLSAFAGAFGVPGTVAAIMEAVVEPRTVAAKLGSEIHAMAEAMHNGQTPQGSALARSYADAYWSWWEGSGWRLIASEAICINPSAGYGGTFDLMAYDADKRIVLADIKTGSVWREAILQMTAYGLCPLVSRMGSDKVSPMPVPDRYVILNVKPEGVRPIEINIGTAERMAWADVLDLHAWQKSVKGKL